MSTKSGTKKSEMFAKLAAQQAQPPALSPDTIAQPSHSHERAGTQAPATTPEPIPTTVDRSPPPVQPTPAAQPTPSAVTDTSSSKRNIKIKGKRENPDFVQANAYIPKKLRRAVEHALLDIEQDYSTLVEDLLRQWLKSRGISDQ